MCPFFKITGQFPLTKQQRCGGQGEIINDRKKTET